MTHIKWFDLQLMAGEGAGGTGGAAGQGGDGTATGDTGAVDAGQRLRELGVPEDKIQRHQARKARRPGAAAEAVRTEPQSQEPKAEEQPTAAAEPTEETKPEDKPQKLSFEELMKDPDYNKEMQKVVQARLRTAKGAEEALSQLTPALELLCRKHGQDPAKPDYKALAEAISNDDSFYEDKALEMGTSVELAKKFDQEERANARLRRQQELTLEQQKNQQHLARLEQQGEAMKTKGFPNFDLRQELRNPVFARMTSPSVGLSVEDAFYAVHRKEIQNAQAQVTAEQTARKISNSIQSGMNRPRENGTAGQAPSVSTFSYKNATPEQRAQLKARIRQAKAEGRTLYPGQ